MAKLVKESLNDTLRSNNPWVQRFIEENGLENGMDDIIVEDLASFIDDNWAEITGLSNRDKDEEGGFSWQVEQILDELGVDYTDFGDAWGMQREGAEDWEDEEEFDEYEDDELYEEQDEYDEEYNEALERAKEQAKRISKEEGVVQHVNEIRPGLYRVEDWYDSDQTVISYYKGMIQ